MAKLDHEIQSRIVGFLRDRILTTQNPRQIGKALQGEKRGLWRYRIGDYRLICDIRDETGTTVVLGVGYRKEVYR